METTRILAKSIKKHRETDNQEESGIFLKEHTRDVWDAFENLSNSKSLPDKHIDEQLKLAIQIAIICHDFGKVLPAFQQRTLRNIDYKPSYPYNNIPHSLFSIFWMDGEKIKELLKNEDIAKFVYSAVAFHHWRSNFDELINWSDGDLCEILNKLTINEKVDNERFRDALCENLKSEFQDFPSELKATEFISFNLEWASGIINGLSLAHYVTPPYKNYFLPKQAELPEEKKKQWVLISGFLMRCDHFASFCEEDGIEVVNNPIEVRSPAPADIKKNIKDKINQTNDKKVWQIKTLDEKDAYEKNIILIAPTGYGKTEFAYLWSNGKKFFYTLPIRSAVNQIFERAKNIFTEEKTGLLHSDADVYLLGDGAETESLKVYDFARQLSYPIIVSTGDQFFPYALKPPSYEKTYATMSYSRLVIDEVQAYDPKAAAIVVKFIEDMVQMGGKFLLMTATLPEFVKKAIERRIGKEDYEKIVPVDIYRDGEQDFQSLKKHKIKALKIQNSRDTNGRPKFELRSKEINQIIERANNGKRVLVIVNTVQMAQNVYERLKEEAPTQLKKQIWLLHSRFTFDDRAERELALCGGIFKRDKNKDKTEILNKEINLQNPPPNFSITIGKGLVNLPLSIEEKDENKIISIQGLFQNPKPTSEQEGKIFVATQVVEASLDIDADVLFTEIAPLDALVQRMGRVLRRFKEKYIYNDAEPNVYIWIFENGLESGNGNVYKRELLGITLRLLYSKQAGKQINEEEVKEWIKSIKWEELEVVSENDLENTTKTNKKGKGKTKEKKRGKPDKQNASQLILPVQPLLLSEFEKYELVKQLYDCLPEDGKYLKDFYDTLRILDAGYMSNEKQEAHKVFREIYTITVIPSDRKDELKQDLKQFLESHQNQQRLYTLFKKEVLSKYVVSVPYNARKFSELYPNHIEFWIKGKPEFEKYEKRLMRWLKNIFFVDYEYSDTLGINTKTENKSNDSAFL